MRVGEAALQYFKDLNREIFGGRYKSGELLQCIQIRQVEAGKHFRCDESVEIDEITDHTSGVVDWAADRDLEGVVVAVSVRVIALAVSNAVFVGRHLGAMQAVRGGEAVTAGEVSFHDGNC